MSHSLQEYKHLGKVGYMPRVTNMAGVVLDNIQEQRSKTWKRGREKGSVPR